MPDESSLTFRFADALPGLCVVCGAPANGQISTKVDLPPDAIVKQMTFLQIIALLFGFIFLWSRAAPGPPKSQWVRLPICLNHNSAKDVCKAVTLTAIDRYSVEIHGASAEFRNAMQLSYGLPSQELLAEFDSGPTPDADKFLTQANKLSVQTADDFLKSLERDTDANH